MAFASGIAAGVAPLGQRERGVFRLPPLSLWTPLSPGQVVAPSVCYGPWVGLASCWPRPQQLLPVSAAGSGRRRCKKGAARPFQTPKK